MLAVPVLCAPQEMVLRLGMVKGIGYARSLRALRQVLGRLQRC